MEINSASSFMFQQGSLSPRFSVADRQAQTGDPARSTEESDKMTPRQTNPESARQLRTLQSRDREVRAHEQAHLAVAGRYATSGANLDYQKGPDGKRYAVGGEVNIDTRPVPGDPRATALKAEVIRRAALAPGNPSAQDRRVAAEASQMAAEARLELQQENSGIIDKPDPGAGLEQRLSHSGADNQPAEERIIDLLA